MLNKTKDIIKSFYNNDRVTLLAVLTLIVLIILFICFPIYDNKYIGNQDSKTEKIELKADLNYTQSFNVSYDNFNGIGIFFYKSLNKSSDNNIHITICDSEEISIYDKYISINEVPNGGYYYIKFKTIKNSSGNDYKLNIEYNMINDEKNKIYLKSANLVDSSLKVGNTITDDKIALLYSLSTKNYKIIWYFLIFLVFCLMKMSLEYKGVKNEK
jgi:hypothetical protein